MGFLSKSHQRYIIFEIDKSLICSFGKYFILFYFMPEILKPMLVDIFFKTFFNEIKDLNFIYVTS